MSGGQCHCNAGHRAGPCSADGIPAKPGPRPVTGSGPGCHTPLAWAWQYRGTTVREGGSQVLPQAMLHKPMTTGERGRHAGQDVVTECHGVRRGTWMCGTWSLSRDHSLPPPGACTEHTDLREHK